MSRRLHGLVVVLVLALAPAVAMLGCGTDSSPPGDGGDATPGAGDGVSGGDDTAGGGGGTTGNQAPAAEIVSPSDGQVVGQDEGVSLVASVSDDGTAAEDLEVAWRSSIDGELGTSQPTSTGTATLEVEVLTAGNHTILVEVSDADGLSGSDEIALVVNGLPSAPQVTLEPESPGTTDTLVVSLAVAVDPNDDPLTYEYTWTRDGEAVSNPTPTVLAQDTAAGEEWTVEVRANDGRGVGPATSASVTIQNTAPSCGGAVVVPSAGATDKDFACSCSGFDDVDGDDVDGDDVDGDDEDVSCTFVDEDGVPVSGSEAGSCELSSELTSKGLVFTCEVTPSDGEDDGAVVTSEPVTVLNTAPTKPTVELSPVAGAVGTLFTCAGQGSVDLDGDTVSYQSSWVVNGYVNPGSATPAVAGALVADAEGTLARGGDQLFCRVRAFDGDDESASADSAVVTLENSPPQGGGAVIAPATATEQTTLTCEATDATDPDGQLVLWTYAWLVDGEVVESVTGPTLTGAHFDKGQVVSCEATPTDGITAGEGVAAKNTVTILNSLPAIEAVTLDPAQANGTGEFTCSWYGWTDADDDPEEVAITWLRDADGMWLPVPGQDGAVLLASLLQPGDLIKCRATPKNGNAVGESLDSDTATVVNDPPSLEGALLTPESPTSVSVLVCEPQGYADGEGTGPFYGYSWKVNNVDLEGQTASTLLGAFARGDVVRCAVTPNDGFEDGPTVVSNEVIIGNTLPVIGSVSVEPDFGPPCAPFTCVPEDVVDPDAGDEVVFQFRWELNGEEIGATGATLTDVVLAADDAIRCHATPSDGEDGAEVASNVATVFNTPPTVDSVTLTPPEATQATQLTCVPEGFDDPDCETAPAYEFEWLANGQPIEGEEGSVLSGTAVAPGTEVRCRATPFDGVALGVAQLSNPVTVDNAAPASGTVTVTAPEGADGPVTCAWLIEPFDTDELVSTWFWQIGDGEEITAGQELDAGLVQHCDLVRCRALVSDGLAQVDTNVAEAVMGPGDDCEDGDACTTHACAAGGGCVQSLNTADCDDADPCTDGDSCSEGVCAGVVADCDDGNPCTEDSCSPGVGCVHTAGVGPCDDADPCTLDSCDLQTQECSNEVLADGSSCDADSDGCTQGDACWGGVCSPGANVECAGGGPCRTAICVSDSAETWSCDVLFTAAGTACNDGLFCTVGDQCSDEGLCEPTGSYTCAAAGSGCQIGVCNEALTTCDYFMQGDGTPCDADGDGCTQGDSCTLGACVPGEAVTCEVASDACALSFCQNLGGEAFTCADFDAPEGTPCDDGLYCTVGESCNDSGGCIAAAERDCEAEVGGPCQTAFCDTFDDTCVAKKQFDGTPCDDTYECTQTDACVNGTCIGAGYVCGEDQLSVAVGGGSVPAMAALGFGRYVTTWSGVDSDAAGLRRSDGYGSREDEEEVLVAVAPLPPETTTIAVQPNGDHVVSWYSLPYCTKSQYGSAECTFGERTLRKYDYLGGLLGEVSPWVGLRTKHGNSASTHTTWGDITDSRLVLLAFADGSFGALRSDDYSYSTSIVGGDPGGIRYYPLAPDLTTGTSTLYVPHSGLGQSAAAFDAEVLVGGEAFAMVWAPSTGTGVMSLLVQSFNAPGDPQGPGYPIGSGGAGSAAGRVRTALQADSGRLVICLERGNDLYHQHNELNGAVQLLETPVQATGDGLQRLGDVATFPDGGYVVVWDSTGADLSGLAVKARVFAADGSPETDEIDVNTYQAGDQHSPGVVVLDNDLFVVGFVGADGKLFTRRYHRDATPDVARVERPASTVTDDDQSHPAAAATKSGRVLLAYATPYAGDDQLDVVGRVVDGSGAEIAAEGQLNTDTIGEQHSPQAAAGDDRFVVTWLSGGDTAHDVHARVLDDDGEPVSAEIVVADSNGDELDHAVAMQPDGAFAVLWQVDPFDFTTSILRNHYDADGVLTTGGLPLHQSLETQADPALAARASDGAYVAAWIESPAGGDSEVMVKSFTGAGAGDAVSVSSGASGTLSNPALALGEDGFGLVCWEMSADDLEVRCRRIQTDDLTPIGPMLTPPAVSLGEQAWPAVAALGDGSFLVGWQSEQVDHEGRAVEYQRYSPLGVALGTRIVANRTWVGEQRRVVFAPLPSAGGTFFVGWQSDGQEGEGQDVVYRVMPPE